MDQKDFMRQMTELIEFGRTKDNILTCEEVTQYCEDMSLSNEQLEMVYAYLTEHQIQVSGYEKKVNEREGEATTDSKYLRIYRRELREGKLYTKEELEALYESLQKGNEEVIHQVVEAHLPRVVTLAGRYKGRGVPLEDLIQEGNLELLTCVSMLCGNQEMINFGEAIDHAVRSRLIEMVDEEQMGNDRETSVLARVNLLLEATRVYAEENGRVATLAELSEFTHMDREEIEMYVELSRGTIELGKEGL